MGVKCFYVEPTGDALATFADGHTEIHAAEAYSGVNGWTRWQPRYRRADTGEIFACLAAVPPGGMWDADWMHDCIGPNTDGRVLVVKLPNGNDWIIDSRASNCTLPNDDNHRWWVRHGEPPNITVDKLGGPTCAAGAGSILSGNYHGFLRNGELVPA